MSCISSVKHSPANAIKISAAIVNPSLFDRRDSDKYLASFSDWLLPMNIGFTMQVFIEGSEVFGVWIFVTPKEDKESLLWRLVLNQVKFYVASRFWLFSSCTELPERDNYLMWLCHRTRL